MPLNTPIRIAQISDGIAHADLNLASKGLVPGVNGLDSSKLRNNVARGWLADSPASKAGGRRGKVSLRGRAGRSDAESSCL